MNEEWIVEAGEYGDIVKGRLIRCKDCKHYDPHDHRCKFFNHGIKENDWCSYGELKNG